MATLYGSNYNNAYNLNKKYGEGEYNGHKKVQYDEITLTAEIANGDKIRMGKIPRGARIVGGRLKIPVALGGAGTVDVGYPTNGVEVAAQAGLLSAAASGAGAVNSVFDGASMLGVKLSAETEIELTFSGVSTTGTGKKIMMITEFIVE